MTMPGTRSRPAHVPPVPTGTFPSPGGDTPAAQCFALQNQVADLYSRWRDSFPDGVSPDELRDNAGAFVASDANAQLHPALQAVKADADQAAKQLNDVINGVKVGDDAASLLAAQAYWQRKEKLLSSIKDKARLMTAARELVKSASPDELPVVVRELSDYLTANGQPTDWLKAAYAERVPGADEAHANAVVKARQRDLLSHNHGNLQRSFQKDTPLLPLFDPATATADAYTDTAGG